MATLILGTLPAPVRFSFPLFGARCGVVALSDLLSALCIDREIAEFLPLVLYLLSSQLCLAELDAQRPPQLLFM